MKLAVVVVLLVVSSVCTGEEKKKRSAESYDADIQAVLRKMSATLAEHKIEIGYIKKKNEELAKKFVLENPQQATQVAFSACLSAQVGSSLGYSSTVSPLVFERVFTNVGDAYSPSTGLFTAPVRGVYKFDWHIYGNSHYSSGAKLFRNAEHIYIASQHVRYYQGSASNSAILELEVGDVVCVKLSRHTYVYETPDRYNTFTGHLIFQN